MKPEVIEHLHHNEDFVKFCDEVMKTREFFITALHDAPTDRIQQVSGRILALDEVLNVAKYRELKEKWNSITT